MSQILKLGKSSYNNCQMNFVNKNLEKITRIRGDSKTRENFLRLERNERVSQFKSNITNYIKKKYFFLSSNIVIRIGNSLS